ncbi:hypothetical protein AB0K48_45030 [Nonomuraea sp. NPDC055795]
MTRLRAQRRKVEEEVSKEGEPIPQRWVVIILASLLAGLTAGPPLPGLMVGLALAALLHHAMR